LTCDFLAKPFVVLLRGGKPGDKGHASQERGHNCGNDRSRHGGDIFHGWQITKLVTSGMETVIATAERSSADPAKC
jgi:hypothetical protein